METKLRKWGNGQGILLSKEVCEDLGAEIGDELELNLANGTLVVTAVRRKRYARTRKMTMKEFAGGWTGGKVGEEWAGGDLGAECVK